MNGTEKRMKYYNLSENIIACDNFLPTQQVEDLYTDFLNNKGCFAIPSWGSDPSGNSLEEFFSSKCGGFDFWLENKTPEDNNSFIESLHQWVLHPGLDFYLEKNGPKIFEFLKRNLKWHIHVICYNNGGYYNWHKDAQNNILFTINLVLNKSPSLFLNT